MKTKTNGKSLSIKNSYRMMNTKTQLKNSDTIIIPVDNIIVRQKHKPETTLGSD